MRGYIASRGSGIVTSIDSRNGGKTALYLDSNGNPIDFNREYRNYWQSSLKTIVKVRYIKETPTTNWAGIPCVKKCAYITKDTLWNGKWTKHDLHIEPSQVIVSGRCELGKGIYLFDYLLPLDEEPKYDWHAGHDSHNMAIVAEIKKKYGTAETKAAITDNTQEA